MSILIKGMEMPTKCSECLLAKLSPTGESLICNYMLSRVPWDERPFDCPLVPVPPHGRLIDADALEADGWRLQRYLHATDGCTIEGMAISCAPSIIPAEEEMK